MADIDKNPSLTLLAADPKLKRENLEIKLNEKTSQIKKLSLMLEDIESIEVKRIKHQINISKKEKQRIQYEMDQITKKLDIIDVEFKEVVE